VGNAELLRGIDLELVPGELLVAIGPNGAGKSTLLKLMSGEIEPTGGEVRLGERLLQRWPLRLLATRMGVLPQHSELSFPFRVHEVVGLGRIPHASGRLRDGEIVSELLERLDIASIADRDYTTLSGGEQQRTQIARIMAQIWDCEGDCLLLMDEPAAYLDLSHQYAALRLIRQRAQQGASAFLILHDVNLAAQFADRILLLNRGETEAIGKPWEVLSVANVERVFNVRASIVPHPEQDRPLIITS
jgi:iron complex transport system ATP-binding protein